MSQSFEEALARNGRLVYTCRGTSMLPMLRERRDLLVIERPDGRLARYSVALYRRDSGEYVCHRVLKVRKGDYVLCGDNQRRREYGITDRHVIGVLTAFVRDGKETRVTDRRYRLYVHLWCDFFWMRAAALCCAELADELKRKWKQLRKAAKPKR